MFHWSPPSWVSGTVSWQPDSVGNIPQGAVHGGKDKDGGDIFVGRAFHEGDLLPAKVCPSHGCAFVCFNEKEISKLEYEVMVSSHTAWKEAHGGDVPDNAIQVGQTSSGEALFVGRTLLDGTLNIGKVHPSHGVLYVPYGGEEKHFSTYEVLILN